MVADQEQASVDLLQDPVDSEAEVAASEEALVVVIDSATEVDLEEAVDSEEVEVASMEAEVDLMEVEVAMVLVVVGLAIKVMGLRLMVPRLGPEVEAVSEEVEDQDMILTTVVTVVLPWAEAMAVSTTEEPVEAIWSLYAPEATGMVMTAVVATEDLHLTLVPHPPEIYP